MNRTQTQQGNRHRPSEGGERAVEAFYGVLVVLVLAMIGTLFVTAGQSLAGSQLPQDHRHATKAESHPYAFPLQ